MPFTLTFDSNQEASARKYFSRKPAMQEVCVDAMKNGVPIKQCSLMPVEPLNPNPPLIEDSCPQVKPPKCESGQKLDVTYGEPPCRTPNYTCRPLTAQDYEMCKARKFSCSENPDDYCCQPNPFADPLEFCRFSTDQAKCSDYWLRNKCVTSYTSGQGITSVQCPPKSSVEPLVCPTPPPRPVCAPDRVLTTGYSTMANGCKIPRYSCILRPLPVTALTVRSNILGNQDYYLGGGIPSYTPLRGDYMNPNIPVYAAR